MAIPNLTATISVDTRALERDLRSGFRTMLEQVRHEVARAIETVASAERDPAVSQRLREVGFMVARQLSHEEAKQAMLNPPVKQEGGKFASSDEMQQAAKTPQDARHG